MGLSSPLLGSPQVPYSHRNQSRVVSEGTRQVAWVSGRPGHRPAGVDSAVRVKRGIASRPQLSHRTGPRLCPTRALECTCRFSSSISTWIQLSFPDPSWAPGSTVMTTRRSDAVPPSGGGGNPAQREAPPPGLCSPPEGGQTPGVRRGQPGTRNQPCPRSARQNPGKLGPEPTGASLVGGSDLGLLSSVTEKRSVFSPW